MHSVRCLHATAQQTLPPYSSAPRSSTTSLSARPRVSCTLFSFISATAQHTLPLYSSPPRSSTTSLSALILFSFKRAGRTGGVAIWDTVVLVALASRCHASHSQHSAHHAHFQLQSLHRIGLNLDMSLSLLRVFRRFLPIRADAELRGFKFRR
jgi:hypothetical protein